MRHLIYYSYLFPCAERFFILILVDLSRDGDGAAIIGTSYTPLGPGSSGVRRRGDVGGGQGGGDVPGGAVGGGRYGERQEPGALALIFRAPSRAGGDTAT